MCADKQMGRCMGMKCTCMCACNKCKITCVCVMGKIVRDTTEPCGTQNVLPRAPNPNRRRNNNNENAQNTATRAKRPQHINQAKYAKKIKLKKSVHTQ